MEQLQFKTRPGERPDKKPKVYFACHPEDHRGYFEEITDEILTYSNCAIYYYAPEDDVAQDEDYYLNLGQMNLVVMPVTSRLLYQPNRAMDTEFAYAVERHIPVLPLMQEQGLADRYKEKFGDLQFLDKHNADPTAIAYEDKLKKYLEAILIGDELAAQVRAAFDAYVFLSYRKKDRKYAQELMRLLHRDPMCRDIAIWYDEFLTPGENFNDSIQAALEKSNLFVLAVTPNLVNETNYIMTTEYPMAKKAAKPILPAEMVKTDADALRGCYPEIPDSVDSADEKRLTDTMLSALGALARRENDQDPQHNFFIGLAYLTGIDVEVDHKRAVELITSAAEAGLTEAMEKIVAMYESGDGVQKDYMEAIQWRERLTEDARLQYEKTGTEAAADAYFSCLQNLGDAWSNMACYHKAKSVYENMLQIADCVYKESSHDRKTEKLMYSYFRLGVMDEEASNLEDAWRWGVKYLECVEVLAENDVMKYSPALLFGYKLLGRICLYDRDTESAKSWYEKALRIAEALSATTEVQTQRYLCGVYNDMGSICFTEGDLEAAENWYSKSKDILESLTAGGALWLCEALDGNYKALGSIYYAKGEFEAARSWYSKSKNIKESLLENNDTAKDQISLTTIYNLLGDTCYAEGELESAKEWYSKSLEILEALAETDVVQVRKEIGEVYNSLGDLFQAEGDLETAEGWLMKSLNILETLSQSGTIISRSDLAGGYFNMGLIAERKGKQEAAIGWYIKSLEIREILVKERKVQSQHDLCIFYSELAESYCAIGRLERDKETLTKSIQIFEMLAENYPNNSYYKKRLHRAINLTLQLHQETQHCGESAWKRIFHRKRKNDE